MTTAIEYAGSRPGLVTPGKITKPPFEISIDTLTLICRNVCTGKGRNDIITLTECAFGETIEFDEHRGEFDGKYWKGSTVRSLKGARLHWNPGSEAGTPGELRIHLTGTVLRGVSLFDLLDYLDVLRGYGAEMTELHVALDDLYKSVPLFLVETAVDDGNISGAHDGTLHRGLGKNKRGHDTVNIGSVHSDKRLTVYAKDKESGDDYYGNRWEAKFRRKYAQTVFEQMFECDSPKSLATYLSGVVLGCVRFVDKTSGDHHTERLPLLGWYNKLCLSVAPAVKVSPVNKKITLRDSVEWVERQVARRLGMIKKAMGARFSSWLNEVMTEKVSYMSPVDEAMIEEFQQHEQQQQQEFEEKKKQQQLEIARERAKTLKLKPDLERAAAAYSHRIGLEMKQRGQKDEEKKTYTRRIVEQWDNQKRWAINKEKNRRR